MTTPHPSYEQFMAISGALLKVVVLSMVIERALAFVFEHKWFRYLCTKSEPTSPLQGKLALPGLKGLLALSCSLAICMRYQFDVLQAVFAHGTPSPLGVLLTGFLVAGGSSGAIALFQAFLGLEKDSREAAIEARIAEAKAQKEIAQARSAQAKAEKEKAEFERDEAKARTEG